MKYKTRRKRKQRDVIALAKEDVNKFYKSTDWDIARESVLIRDKFECQRCNGNWCDGINQVKEKKLTKAIVVHHIVALKDNYNKALDLNNLVSLCRECHEIVEDRHQFRFKRKIPLTKERWD